MAAAPHSPGPKRPPTPRWVKLSGIIAAVVVVVIVVVALLFGGDHGPSRHQPGDDSPRGHTPPAQHSR